jgi:hypothetical protein
MQADALLTLALVEHRHPHLSKVASAMRRTLMTAEDVLLQLNLNPSEEAYIAEEARYCLRFWRHVRVMHPWDGAAKIAANTLSFVATVTRQFESFHYGGYPGAAAEYMDYVEGRSTPLEPEKLNHLLNIACKSYLASITDAEEEDALRQFTTLRGDAHEDVQYTFFR